jgi:hypothetical protein
MTGAEHPPPGLVLNSTLYPADSSVTRRARVRPDQPTISFALTPDACTKRRLDLTRPPTRFLTGTGQDQARGRPDPSRPLALGASHGTKLI